MWPLVLLWIYLTEATDETLISLRDPDFVGPDKQLEALMARRRMIAEEEFTEMIAVVNVTLPRTSPAQVSANQQQFDDIYKSLRSSRNKIKPDQVVLHLIKFLIYKVHYRLDDLSPIVKKYERDERFRFGHIFCSLDHWKREMSMWFLMILRSKKGGYHQIMYYQHILSRNIDITYTTTFLIHLQTIYERQLRKQQKAEGVSFNEGANKAEFETIKKELMMQEGLNITDEQLKQWEQKYRQQ